jgi:secondary thiamine-phosphate synthase enzyme
LRVHTKEVEVQTRGHCDVKDVTATLQKALADAGLQEGQATVFVAGSTAGVTTVEFEPGLVRDLNEFFQKIIPEGPDYHHHDTWGDDNGSSHIRAALLKPSLTLPFAGGRLLLGTWQQVVLIDFDTRPRRRSVIFQFMGSGPDD